MSEVVESRGNEPGVLLCVDSEYIDQTGAILRHLLVGLVDESIPIRVASEDPRVSTMALGPVRAIQHGPMHGLATRRRLQRLIELLAPNPPAVVHASSSGSYRLAFSLAEEFDVQLVLQVSSLIDCDELSRYASSTVDRVVVSSAALRSIVVEQMKIPTDRCTLIPPGLPSAETPSCFASQSEETIVFCTSPLEKGSGVEHLIDATVQIRQQKPVLLFLAGSGSYERALRIRVSQKGAAPYVIFAPPLPDLGASLHGADLLVRPAPLPSFAYDCLQAMALGVAVLTCRDSVNDHLRNDETAFLLTHPSTTSLIEAISTLIEDHPRAITMAKKAMDYVREHHSMSQMAHLTAGMYREMFASRATYSIGVRES